MSKDGSRSALSGSQGKKLSVSQKEKLSVSQKEKEEDGRGSSRKSNLSATKLETNEEPRVSSIVKRLPSLHSPKKTTPKSGSAHSAGGASASPEGAETNVAKISVPEEKALVDPALVVHRFSKRDKDQISSQHPRPSDKEGRNSDDYGSHGGTDLTGFTDFWGDDSYNDDQEQLDAFYAQYFGEEGDLDDSELWDENDDTIRRSTDFASDGNDTGPLEEPKNDINELSKKSFRWFERRILADQIFQQSENERRKILLEKCQMLRKVSKPVVTIFGGHADKSKVLVEKESTKLFLTSSVKKKKVKDSQFSMEDGSIQEGDEGSVVDEDDTIAQVTIPEFSKKAWAMKGTIDFLTTAGCTSSEPLSYTSRLKSAKEEAADYRLVLYEQQLKRRREAIGHHMQAPEITAAIRRAAERAIWRAVIDNTKPRYPLPRFILPRHQYLRKVQAQFIGPGSYEIDVYEKQTKARQMRLPSTWGNCSSRFPKEKDPSGGSHPPLLDPWTTLDKANYKKRYPGTYVPFESTPKCYMGKALTNGPGSRIPPNAYNIKSPLEEFIKKKTSLRGPYDCYTPSRSIIPYGYYISTNDEEKARLGPGSYEIRTSLVKEMNDSYNFFKGKLGMADRYSIFGFKAAFDRPLWPRKGVMIPPPGHYDVGKNVIGSDKKQNKAPFRIGAKGKELRERGLTAPDYYYFASGATWTTPPKGASLASVFNSTTPQIMTQKMNLVRKMRNKPVNKNLDNEGGGHANEVHYVPLENFKNDYFNEDCNNPCWKEKGGLIKDPYAIPGHGLGSSNDPSRFGLSCGGNCGVPKF